MNTARPYHTLITTDIQDANREMLLLNNESTAEAAETAVAVIGNLLENADSFVAELESNDMLGSAIVRRCHELADLLGGLATEMESQSEDEKRTMARACLEDGVHFDYHGASTASTASTASITSTGPTTTSTASTTASTSTTTNQIQRLQQHNDQHIDQHEEQQLAAISLADDEVDMMDALSGAQALMRDIEASLRSIDRNEADEIADVALTVARLFILSLQNIHSTVTPQQLQYHINEATGTSNVNRRDLEFSNRVEIIDNDIRNNDRNVSTNQATREGTTTTKKDNSKATTTTTNDRMRALWPPLGPAVADAAHWGKDEAIKKPLLAIALGLTLWPAAICTAIMGTPVVIADGLVQHAYNSFSNTPIITTVERGAAQLYQAGKLSILCSGLLFRQTLRVASRQVDRQGGPGQVAQNVGGAVIDRITHPVETVGMAWGAVCFGAGAICNTVGFVHNVVVANQQQHDDDGGVASDADSIVGDII